MVPSVLGYCVRTCYLSFCSLSVTMRVLPEDKSNRLKMVERKDRVDRPN